MTGLDLLVIAVIGISLVIGSIRGFMYEAAMLFGWVVAFFVARLFAPELAGVFEGALSNENWRMGISYLVIFVGVLFANSILAFLLKALFSKSALRPIDRCLGAVFGILRAGVILLVLTLVVYILRMQDETWWKNAYTAPLLDEAMVVSRPYLRTVLNLDDTDMADGLDLLNNIQNPTIPERLGLPSNTQNPTTPEQEEVKPIRTPRANGEALNAEAAKKHVSLTPK